MKLSWGIIGCGDVTERKGGPALYKVPGSELVAVMRRDGAKAADFAARHGARRHYDRVDALLNDPDVNAVYVATPPCAHAEQTIQAARAGKHVLCEKPMAMNVAEGEAMVAACRDAGVQLMIAYYRRRFPAVLRIAEHIAQGAIGRPIVARVEVAGVHRAPTTASQRWRLDPAIAGGGLLMDVGAHAIDLLHLWLGDVADVAAFTDTVAHDLAVENSSVLILRFVSGAQATVTVHQNVGIWRNTMIVTGTEGSVELVGGLACRGVTLQSGDGRQDIDLPPPDPTHEGIVQNLVAAVERGEANCVTGDEGLKTTRVLAAAYESSARPGVVGLNPPQNKGDGSLFVGREAGKAGHQLD